jgi:hypothetical protein
MDYDQGKCKEALVYFEKAKDVLVKFKHREDYITLLFLLSKTYPRLNLWTEALKCINESIELTFGLYGDNCLLYALSIYHYAMFHFNLKQYEEAISRFEKAHVIFVKEYGLKDKNTIEASEFIAKTREHLLNPHRELIEVNHNFRMCSSCKIIKEDMDSCTACFKVSYCDKDCQLKDWPNHKSSCRVCLQCSNILDRDSNILRCSRCKKVQYCSEECQKIHWKEHKLACIPSEIC